MTQYDEITQKYFEKIYPKKVLVSFRIAVFVIKEQFM